MAEKNTLAILENIRKKIQKLDEPRKVESKDFSDIGDEFDYAIPAKKNSIVDKAEEEPAAKPDPVKTYDAIEREITESFEFDQEEESAEPADEEAEDAELEVDEDDLDFEFDEDLEEEEDSEEDELSLEEHSEELEAEPAELETESEELVIEAAEEDLQLEGEGGLVEDIDPQDEDVEEDLQPEDEAATEEDLHLEDDYTNNDNAADLNLEQVEEPINSLELNDAAKEIAENKEVKIKTPLSDKSDEDELEELLRQEAASKAKAPAPIAPSKPPLASMAAPSVPLFSAPAMVIAAEPAVLANSTASELQPVDTNKKTFNNVDEFLTHSTAQESLLSQQSAASVTDSIKKLVDAKNVVSGVTSFSKSEAFSDIAAQLMEPRLEKWLNENLPSLVERIVRDEIKKIIPKE